MTEVPGGVPGFEPFIRYHTFGESSVDFTVILRANEFVDQYLVKHEFIKGLHARFEQEGIVIPFPIRTIAQRDGAVASFAQRSGRRSLRHICFGEVHDRDVCILSRPDSMVRSNPPHTARDR